MTTSRFSAFAFLVAGLAGIPAAHAGTASTSMTVQVNVAIVDTSARDTAERILQRVDAFLGGGA